MKVLIISFMIVSLLLLPLAAYTQTSQVMSAPSSSEQSAASPPGVSQPLIPEGQFALQLVSALKLGTAKNEADAENILASVGITPKNGWISEYPMTPIVVGELQDSMQAAANSGKLTLTTDDAMKAFEATVANAGLSMQPATGAASNESQQPPTYGEYSNPDVVDNYYYDYGPPVVTYYPPPWDYDYIYAWVPYPFCCSGFFFPGFFILNDFSTVVVVDGHHFVCTNHVFDPATRTVARIDPRTGVFVKSVGAHHAFTTSEGRKGAESIFRHNAERANIAPRTPTMANRGFMERGTAAGRPEGQMERQIPSEGNRISPNFSRPAPSGREFHGPTANHAAPYISRSYSSPLRSENRSFSSSSVSHSFFGGGSAPRGSFGGFHSGGFGAAPHGGSFGGFHGGSFAGGFHGGGSMHR